MTEAERVPPLRRTAARALDVLAIVVILAAAGRLAWPYLHHQGAIPAPPVSIATLEGGRFDLTRHHGRLVFLDFWATWCDPCRASIPLVQRFKRAHPEVDVVSVDVGEGTDLVRPFARQFAMRDVALDPDKTVANAFGIDGFPTVVAVDGSGRIVARWIGYDENIEKAMGGAVSRYGTTKTALAAGPAPNAR